MRISSDMYEILATAEIYIARARSFSLPTESVGDRWANISLSPHYRIVSSEKDPQVPFPWSAYLSQPLFHPKHKLILNPKAFRKKYQVRLLESCLNKKLRPNRFRNISGFN